MKREGKTQNYSSQTFWSYRHLGIVLQLNLGLEWIKMKYILAASTSSISIQEIQTLQIKATCSPFHDRLSYHTRSYPGLYLNASIYNLNLPGPSAESATLYKYIMNPEHVPAPLTSTLVMFIPGPSYNANLSRVNIDSSKGHSFMGLNPLEQLKWY